MLSDFFMVLAWFACIALFVLDVAWEKDLDKREAELEERERRLNEHI